MHALAHSPPEGLAPINEAVNGQPWRCTRCEHRALGERPLGCSLCGRANTFARASDDGGATARSAVLSWSWAADASAELVARAPSGVRGFDRVTGGGLARGVVTFLGGARGTGKSTLALNVASGVAGAGLGPVLVAPLEQGREAARRMLDEQGSPPAGIAFSETPDVDELGAMVAELRPALVVVDSWKMLRVGGRTARSNTLAERASVLAFQATARAHQCAVLGILHMQASNPRAYAAGSALLQLCDVLLRFDPLGEGRARLLCDGKNRYGTALERSDFRRDDARLCEVTTC